VFAIEVQGGPISSRVPKGTRHWFRFVRRGDESAPIRPVFRMRPAGRRTTPRAESIATFSPYASDLRTSASQGQPLRCDVPPRGARHPGDRARHRRHDDADRFCARCALPFCQGRGASRLFVREHLDAADLSEPLRRLHQEWTEDVRPAATRRPNGNAGDRDRQAASIAAYAAWADGSRIAKRLASKALQGQILGRAGMRTARCTARCFPDVAGSALPDGAQRDAAVGNLFVRERPRTAAIVSNGRPAGDLNAPRIDAFLRYRRRFQGIV